MSYRESECYCSWCGCNIATQSKDYIACNSCYERLEFQVPELERQIAELKAEIERLKG